MPILAKGELTIQNLDIFNIYDNTVFLDIETSGLDNTLEEEKIDDRAEILEIGAIKFVDNEIKEFNILIKNQFEVPNNIFELCQGLSPELLRQDGIELKEAIDKLEEFLDGSIIVCHNGKFEDSFLKFYYKECGKEFKNLIIDSMELAAIFEPTSKEFNLNYLIKSTTTSETEEVHRGFMDAVDTVCVVNSIIYRYLEDNQDTNGKIYFDKIFDKIQNWPWMKLLEKVKSIDNIPWYIKSKHHKIDNEEVALPNICTSLDILDDVERFRIYYNPAYLNRDEQKYICEYISTITSNGKIGIIEGPVGIGKTLPYIINSVILACNIDEDNSEKVLINLPKVVISTKTKKLMKEITEEYLPKVLLTMGVKNKIKYIELKGKSNYLCLKKLENIEDTIDINYMTYNENLLYVVLYNKYKNGEIGIGENEINFAVKRLFVDKNEKDFDYQNEKVDKFINSFSCSSDCDMENCKYKDKCIFVDIYNNAKDSHIIVTNHSLLSRWTYDDIKFKYVICDEAHELIQEAEGINTTTINIQALIRTINKYTSKIIKAVIDNEILDEDDKKEIINEIQNTVKLTNESYLKFYYQYLDDNNLQDKKYDDHKNLLQDNDNYIINIKNSVENLILVINNIDINKEEYKKFIDILIKTIDELDMVLKFNKDELCRVIYNNSTKKLEINLYREQHKSDYYNRCFSNSESTIFISGTLRVESEDLKGDTLKYFKDSVGLNQVNNKEIEALPPITPIYDYKTRIKIAIPKDAEKYNYNDDSKFKEAFIEFIKKIADEVPSNILVLFCSNDRRDNAYKHLQQHYKNKDINICKSNKELEKLSVSGNKTIFLGSRGQFQGISLVGDKLNVVVLEKLPNIYQKDPQVDLRNKITGTESYNNYRAVNQPRVSMLLKQIFGRVIRSEYDYGYLFVYNGLQDNYNPDVNQLRNLFLEGEIIDNNIDNILNGVEDNFINWICINIKDIIMNEKEGIKLKYISLYEDNMDHNFAFENSLNLIFKDKCLDYRLEVITNEEEDLLKGLYVYRKGLKYNIYNNYILPTITELSLELKRYKNEEILLYI